MIPWSPLARGRLARPWDERASTERAGTDEFGKTLYARTEQADRAVVDRLGEVAEARGLPRAQVALAWMLAQARASRRRSSAPPSRTTSTTPSPRSSIELTPEEIARLEEPYVPHPVLGFS